MTRSKNSRRGNRHKHAGRHSHCGDRHCDYCEKNFKHAEDKQREKGKDE